MSTTITVEEIPCERKVEDAVREVRGVTDASADRDAERASVEGDAEFAAHVRAVQDAEYTASA